MKDNRILMILGAIALVVIIYMILQKEKYNKSSTVTVYNSDNVDHVVTWGEACCSRQHSSHKGDHSMLNCDVMALDNTNFGTVPANGSLTIHPQMPSCTGDPNTISGSSYMFSISTTTSQGEFYDNNRRLTSNVYSYGGLDQSIALMISKDHNDQLTIKGPKNKPIIVRSH